MTAFFKHPKVSLVLKFGFAAAILIFMVKSGRLDLNVVKHGFEEWQTILVSLALILIAAFASFVRWGLLLEGQGVHFSLYNKVRYGLIGCFFNTTLPGAVSGDFVKAWFVVSEQKHVEKTPLIASILLDRVLGVFGLVTVATIALVSGWNLIWGIPEMHAIAWAILFLAAGMVTFFLYIMLSVWGPLAKLRSLMDALQKFGPGRVFLKGYDAWMVYRKAPEILAKAMLLSMLTHICTISSVIACAGALGERGISVFQYFLLVPLGLLTTAVPVAPAGLGVGHVAFNALFSRIGSNHGAEIFTLFVTIQILVNLTGIYFYLKAPHHPHAGDKI